MSTLITTIPVRVTHTKERNINFNPIKLFCRFADGQKKNETLWWFISLMVHGNLVLAIPAALVYYYHAPIAILGITVMGFFLNLVLFMGGSNIRVNLAAFFISLLFNISMLLIYVL